MKAYSDAPLSNVRKLRPFDELRTSRRILGGLVLGGVGLAYLFVRREAFADRALLATTAAFGLIYWGSVYGHRLLGAVSGWTGHLGHLRVARCGGQTTVIDPQWPQRHGPVFPTLSLQTTAAIAAADFPADPEPTQRPQGYRTHGETPRLHLTVQASAAKQRHLARWASLQLLLGFGVIAGVSMPIVTIMALFLGLAAWVQYPRRLVDAEIIVENGFLTAKSRETTRIPLKDVIALQWSASRIELWVHRGGTHRVPSVPFGRKSHRGSGSPESRGEVACTAAESGRCWPGATLRFGAIAELTISMQLPLRFNPHCIAFCSQTRLSRHRNIASLSGAAKPQSEVRVLP